MVRGCNRLTWQKSWEDKRISRGDDLWNKKSPSRDCKEKSSTYWGRVLRVRMRFSWPWAKHLKKWGVWCNPWEITVQTWLSGYFSAQVNTEMSWQVGARVIVKKVSLRSSKRQWEVKGKIWDTGCKETIKWIRILAWVDRQGTWTRQWELFGFLTATIRMLWRQLLGNKIWALRNVTIMELSILSPSGVSGCWVSYTDAEGLIVWSYQSIVGDNNVRGGISDLGINRK